MEAEVSITEVEDKLSQSGEVEWHKNCFGQYALSLEVFKNADLQIWLSCADMWLREWVRWHFVHPTVKPLSFPSWELFQEWIKMSVACDQEDYRISFWPGLVPVALPQVKENDLLNVIYP